MTRYVMEYEAFFGDSKRKFRLTAPLIIELERTTGVGIGSLCKRVFSSDFRLHEATEVIRLGMIGAGETPETAKALIDAYLADQPLGGALPIATEILNTLLFGIDPDTLKETL